MRHKDILAGTLTAGMLALCSAASAQPELIHNGEARAEIVIATQPPRMASLAAEELQTYLEKISGARLTITNAPSDRVPLRIYVGRSAYTDALGIDDAGLDNGAFRMRSVADGLVLLGQDADFVPRQPFTMNAGNHPDCDRMWAAWDAITGDTVGNPRGQLSRQYSGRMKLWSYDQRGSLNAVYAFLRGLGVRWYMPGELGEIVPHQATIDLPQIDRAVQPAFDWRRVALSIFFSSPREEILWYLRQGFNSEDVVGHFSHGLRDVSVRAEMKQTNPERYALVRGVRQTERNHPCLSSQGLFDSAVRFARAMFDTYDLPMVSMMPQDGFQFCQCELCVGKDHPELGRDGMYSDYVWSFVDRVAREVIKTHPNKRITCLAYGTYSLPPPSIARLSPNVVVGLIHSRRNFDDPQTRAKQLALRQAWREKTDQPFWNWEHYPFTQNSTFTPDYYPHAIAAGLRSMTNDYFGEFIETATGPFAVRGHGLHTPGFNHLNLYVTGRLQWDTTQDVDALLAEYYQKFYGPAAAEMRAFIETSEAYRIDLKRDTEKIDRVLTLFDAAVAKASPDTAYGQRIALVGEYLQKLREWRAQLARGRENVPIISAPARAAGLALNGQLDDAVWRDLPAHPLVDVKSGDAPQASSWFKIYWEGGDGEGHLVVGVHCNEPDMANVGIRTTEPNDPRVFDGDTVELMIETQAHSYYQLAINAAGAMDDLDRNYGRLNREWSAQAQVAAYRGKDFWSVEVRLPVTGEDTPGDPLHELAGRRPTAQAPWHIQVGRQRMRGQNVEWTAWSPTGSNFHDIMRFGRVE